MSYVEDINVMAKSTGTLFPDGSSTLASGDIVQVLVDAKGNLITRSSVLTDEDSLYEPFAGSALSLAWTPFIFGGDTIDVSGSICRVNSSTTSSSKTGVSQLLDYAPMAASFTLALNDRLNNCDVYFGFTDVAPNSIVTQQARFYLTKSTNNPASGSPSRYVRCVTQSSSDVGAIEGLGTDILLPEGYTTDQFLLYKIGRSLDGVRFYVGTTHDNLQLISTHSNQLPPMYAKMYLGQVTVNGVTPPVSGSILSIDTITVRNNNLVDVEGDIKGEVKVSNSLREVNKTFTYDVNNNITVISEYYPLENVTITKTFSYDVNSNITNIVVTRS